MNKRTFSGDVADYSSITLEMSKQPPLNIASMYLFMGMMSIPAQQEGYLKKNDPGKFYPISRVFSRPCFELNISVLYV